MIVFESGDGGGVEQIDAHEPFVLSCNVDFFHLNFVRMKWILEFDELEIGNRVLDDRNNFRMDIFNVWRACVCECVDEQMRMTGKS